MERINCMKKIKSTKKQFYIGLGMVLLLPLFAACGNNEPNTGQEPNPGDKPSVQEPVNQEPTRFLGSEAVYNGIGLGATMEQVKEKLGEPQKTDEGKIDDVIDDGIAYTKYIYADATYYFYYNAASSAQRTISYIEVTTSTAKEGPRGLKVGDTLDEVLAKYPQEKDWKTDTNGSFYGEDTFNGDAGAVYKDENDAPNLIILTPKEIVPFIRIDIQDHTVTSYTLCYDLH